jgi:uncharacterized protein
MKIRSFISIFFLLVLGNTIAQQNNSTEKEKPEKPKIAMLARAYGDSICLRWGATNFTSWNHCNTVGLVLERFTLLKNGKIIEGSKEKVLLSIAPIKPLPAQSWLPLIDKNKYAFLYANSLYGEDFKLTSKNTDIFSMINKSRVDDDRYSYALFSADQSVEVAKAAGLWYTDKNVRKGEKYVYRIYPAIAKANYPIDTGFAFIAPDEIGKLPKPIELKAEWGDKVVNLQWTRKYFESIYSTYFVERSDDGGKTFKRTGDLPMVNITPDGRPKADYMYAVDSLPENDKLFVFRVKGINPFGETGPPSDTVRGMGIEPIAVVPPVVFKAEPTNDGKITLQWIYPDSLLAKTKGFIISRAPVKNKNDYKDISTLLPNTERSYKDPEPRKAAYYMVKAIDKKDKVAYSFPILGQLRDSIPPIPPVLISAKIDSAGIVRIKWKQNKEEDLLGYRVFFSNSANEEYAQITRSPIQDTLYTDTVEIKTLTKKVFYKLVALDEHFNPSNFSAPIELKRPDIIPPSAPYFEKISSVTEGILVQWVPSTSNDAVTHVVYRRKPGESKWITIAVVDTGKHERQFLDKQVEKGKEYEYTMLAVDESRLESDLVKPLKITHIDNGIRPAVNKFKFELDTLKKVVRLKWDYEDKTVQRYLIYKSEKGKQLRLYNSVTGDKKEFYDRTLSPNTIYVYRIRAVMPEGVETEFSKELEVVY